MSTEQSWPASEGGPLRVLLVEDEELMRSIIAQLLSAEGYEIIEAHAAEVALTIFEKQKIDVAVLDLNLGHGGNGLDLLGRIRDLDPEVMGIILTAYASVESAVDALRKGAYDYLTKPFANDHLKAVVRNALSQKALFRENRFLRRELRDKYSFENIIGKSDSIQQVFRLMEKVARTDSSVLITGESGTGKELVARAIHFTSERGNGRFLPINCGALPETLLESELFGYKRGAFTGATQDKVGLLKSADKGTLFLDEIGEMPLQLQVKLLRALQERECYPVGSNEPVRFDVRLLCATNRDLEAGGARGPLSRGTALPHQRHHHPAAPAARAQGRYPAAGQLFSAQVREGARTRPDAIFQGRDAPAGQLRLARQRARAGKRGRARRHPGRKRSHPFPRPARQAGPDPDRHHRPRGLRIDPGGTWSAITSSAF